MRSNRRKRHWRSGLPASRQTLDGRSGQNPDAAAGTKSAAGRTRSALDAWPRNRQREAGRAIPKNQQELARRGAASSDLGDPLAALEHQAARAEAGADRSGAVLLLALLADARSGAEARPFPGRIRRIQEVSAGDDPELARRRRSRWPDAARDGVSEPRRLTAGGSTISRADRPEAAAPEPPSEMVGPGARPAARSGHDPAHRRSGRKTGRSDRGGAAPLSGRRSSRRAAVSALEQLTGAKARGGAALAADGAPAAGRRSGVRASAGRLLAHLGSARPAAFPGGERRRRPAAAPRPRRRKDPLLMRAICALFAIAVVWPRRCFSTDNPGRVEIAVAGLAGRHLGRRAGRGGDPGGVGGVRWCCGCLSLILGSPRAFLRRRRERRRRAGYQALTRGMVAVAAGDPAGGAAPCPQSRGAARRAAFDLVAVGAGGADRRRRHRGEKVLYRDARPARDRISRPARSFQPGLAGGRPRHGTPPRRARGGAAPEHRLGGA